MKTLPQKIASGIVLLCFLSVQLLTVANMLSPCRCADSRVDHSHCETMKSSEGATSESKIYPCNCFIEHRRFSSSMITYDFSKPWADKESLDYSLLTQENTPYSCQSGSLAFAPDPPYPKV
ncbi:hypothetical protein [Pseudobacteriovorax antillogorgiicola]|uniref:Uncharacterized protein n=1 Tax=Pseudobacteriovorax antillogorgiicola TaxID=1513793 RepID=A0A1Y6BSE5_9BACT|nr:hypothetical protein [Pseudobacteriovorax antillogorgiicola]TCS53015.1 hypothetical protein EDD56_10866 [Pseudobacteriovorax antillogorgiicola]SMF26935.1 hypothetical protein SAMN06296036_108181 [Pseudobacteriovorax antillogorgiicola]